MNGRADLDFADNLKNYQYVLAKMNDNDQGRRNKIKGDFLESVGMSSPKDSDGPEASSMRQQLLLLGCGNSKLGEDILHHFIDLQYHPISRIVQCDVSPVVIKSMRKRCCLHVGSDLMSLVEDDATRLKRFDDEIFDAVLDKGLVDALFCANENEQLRRVVKSAHRVLGKGKCFIFFSFSQPEFLLERSIAGTITKIVKGKQKGKLKSGGGWSHMEVREMNGIYMYRFIK